MEKEANSDSVVPTLVGTYTIASSENVNEYLKGLGVGLVLRKVLAVVQPVCYIFFNSETSEWKVGTKSIFNSKESIFKSKEKFSDETFDNRQCQSYVEVQENGKVLKWYQVCEQGPDVEVLMTSTETGFTEVLQSGDLQCEFKFRRGLPLNQLLDRSMHNNNP